MASEPREGKTDVDILDRRLARSQKWYRKVRVSRQDRSVPHRAIKTYLFTSKLRKLSLDRLLQERLHRPPAKLVAQLASVSFRMRHRRAERKSPRDSDVPTAAPNDGSADCTEWLEFRHADETLTLVVPRQSVGVLLIAPRNSLRHERAIALATR